MKIARIICCQLDSTLRPTIKGGFDIRGLVLWMLSINSQPSTANSQQLTKFKDSTFDFQILNILCGYTQTAQDSKSNNSISRRVGMNSIFS